MRCFLFLFVLTCLGPGVYAQYVIKADSVKLTGSTTTTSELIIENQTKNVSGYLYNKGNGRTEFRAVTATGGSGGSTLYKVYANDHSGSTVSRTYTLMGWNVDYSSSVAPDTSHPISCQMDFDIWITGSLPLGTVISVQLAGNTVYTLTVSGSAISSEKFVIGSIRINQDIKYPSAFFVKGATETINGSGTITSTPTAYRFTGSFTNPTLTIAMTGSTNLVRIGTSYLITKKNAGNWQIN